MDKRDLSQLFRDRLGELIAADGSTSRFLRDTGVDRSALSQFLDPGSDRLPRAETLRKIASAKGVTADWLLGLTNAEEKAPEIADSVDIELALDESGASPLERWRREARGQKLRYVPSTFPDMLRLPEVMDYELERGRAEARMEQGEQVLDTARIGDMDVEIAMPRQTIEDFARGSGIWSSLSPELRQRQLDYLTAVVAESYPVLRLHLYDGRRNYAAPFTVFGPIRAAIYLGGAYLVVTSTEKVRAMARLFDGLVRAAEIGSERVRDWLAALPPCNANEKDGLDI